jgi:hypothetical protein
MRRFSAVAILALAFLHLAISPVLGQARQERASAHPVFPAGITGIWLMGQSLCEGSESLPVVTAAETGWANLSFGRGVRTWRYNEHGAEPERRSAADFALVPLRAQAEGGLGETMANGLADHLKAGLHAGLEKKDAAAKAPQFLVAYAGQGGRMIEELSAADESTDPRTPEGKRHGGGYYRTSLDDARRAVLAVEAQGKAFAIGALVWMQGEGNGGPTGGIVPSRWAQELPSPQGQHWYRERLMAYRRQWSADLAAITGQRGELPMFTYQTLGPAGAAQLMAADADPHLTMIGPHYAVPSAINSRTTRGRHGDAIHLAADGERWFGEQAAKVIRRVLVDKEDWQPLRPLRAWVEPGDRRSIVIDFHVPRPPLVLDTTFLPRQEIHAAEMEYVSLAGFRVHGQRITAVEVVPPSQVRIHLANPIAKDTPCALSYGHPDCGYAGRIHSVRPGPNAAEQPTTELIIEAPFPKRFEPLLAEGAFRIINEETGSALAMATVRHVIREPRRTILRLENRDLRNGTPFAAGQTFRFMRPFSYGNLRDSDPEKALFTFGDSEYGTRAGQPYPLWNWCVLFNDLAVGEKL